MKYAKEVSFWVIVSALLILIFGKPYGGYINSFYFVTFLLPVILGTSYLFNAYLIPNFLLTKKYTKFGLYTLYTVIVSLNLQMLIVVTAFAVLANYKFAQMIPGATNISGLAITLYFIVLLKAFVLILKSSFSTEEKVQTLEEKQKNMAKGYLLVRADRKNVKILLEDILYIESLSDYVKIFISEKQTIITKEKISAIEQKLSSPFTRVHRSFIVNADKIDSFTSESVEINGSDIPVSRSYKSVLLSLKEQ
ncbi:MAG: LytTR family transcriptional regulator [Cyclobacteriaceae bacterium]|nr:LytTR family transcriptional regulator [Cyclobacteriaceae bacterium]